MTKPADRRGRYQQANPDEIYCTLEATLVGTDAVVLKDDAGAAHQAIREAIGKLKRAVASMLAKHDPMRNTELPTDQGSTQAPAFPADTVLSEDQPTQVRFFPIRLASYSA